MPSSLPHGPQVVLIWLSDESGAAPVDLGHRYRAVFKSYWPLQSSLGNIHPFPLCTRPEILSQTPVPFQDRENNVTFSGNLNANRVDLFRQFNGLRFLPPCDIKPYLLRRLYLEALQRLTRRRDFSDAFPDSRIQFTDGFGRGLPGNLYAKSLFHSRIAICPAGFMSPECIRHFEAMAAGAIVISTPLPPNRWYLGSPIIQIDSWRKLSGTVATFMQEPEKGRDLAEQTSAWWDEVCSPEAVAFYAAEQLR